MEAVPITFYGKQYWKVGDDIYVKSKDKLLLIDHFDGNGKPVLTSECWSEETVNLTGGQDCTIHVPCLQIATKQQE